MKVERRRRALADEHQHRAAEHRHEGRIAKQLRHVRQEAGPCRLPRWHRKCANRLEYPCNTNRPESADQAGGHEPEPLIGRPGLERAVMGEQEAEGGKKRDRGAEHDEQGPVGADNRALAIIVAEFGGERRMRECKNRQADAQDDVERQHISEEDAAREIGGEREQQRRGDHHGRKRDDHEGETATPARPPIIREPPDERIEQPVDAKRDQENAAGSRPRHPAYGGEIEEQEGVDDRLDDSVDRLTAPVIKLRRSADFGAFRKVGRSCHACSPPTFVAAG